MSTGIQRALDTSLRPLIGDDVFISYSREDGATYAAGLASELAQRGLSCRFDQWGSEPGKEVPLQIINALRRSGLLVIVCTTGATRSPSIEQEIQTFIKTKRLIVPIDLDGSLRKAPWWPLIEGLPISDDQYKEQQSEAGRSPHVRTKPSSKVVDRVENSITFTKKNQRLRRIATATLAVVVLLIAAAFLVIHRASAIAESRKLAKQALDAPATNHQLALEMAVRAVETYPSEEAIDSLKSAINGFDHDLGPVVPSVSSNSQNGKFLAIASPFGDAKLVDTEHQLETTLCGLAGPIKHFAFSPSEHYLLAMRQEGRNDAFAVQIWDTQTRRQTGVAHVSASDNSARIWIAPGETRFIVGSSIRPLQLFELPSGKLIQKLEGTFSHDHVVFNPKNSTFLSYRASLPDMSDPPAIWNLDSGQQLWKLDSGPLFRSATFDSIGNTLLAELDNPYRKPYGFTLLTLDENGIQKQSKTFDRADFDYASLRNYRLPDFDARLTLGDVLHSKYPNLVKDCGYLPIDPTGTIAVCTQDGKAPLIFGLMGLTLMGPLDQWNLGDVYHVEFSSDGSTIAFVDYDGLLGVWSTASRKRLWTQKAFSYGSTAFSHDGHRLFIWDSGAGIVKIFETASGTLLHTLAHPDTKMISSGASISDLINVLWMDTTGQHAVTRTEEGVFLWDADREQILYSKNLFTSDSERLNQDREQLNQDRKTTEKGSAMQLLQIAKRRLQLCQ